MAMTRKAILPGQTISISVVVYKTAAKDLAHLLAGIMGYRRICMLTVVDNSPTQALRPVVESAGAVYVSAGKNLGYGAGHNLAMRSAIEQSAYHLVCNPDIVCDPEVLEALLAFMETSPEVGLVMPKVVYSSGKEQRLCKLLPTPVDLFIRRFAANAGGRIMRKSRERYELGALDLDVAREVPSLSGCFMFFRTSVLHEVGLFDPRYFMYMEDVDLCRRVGAVARTVFYPAVSVVHGYAKGSYAEPKLLGFHLVSAVRYFNKWGWLYDPMRRSLNRRLDAWTRNEAPGERLAPSRRERYLGTHAGPFAERPAETKSAL